MKARIGSFGGVVAMSLLWAVVWALPGGGIEAIDNLTASAHGFTRRVDMWPQTLGLPGLIGGLIFSVVLSVGVGRRSVAELPVPLSAGWGAVAGVLTGGVVVWLLYTGLSRSWQAAATAVAVATLLGTVSGVASPLVFRYLARKRAAASRFFLLIGLAAAAQLVGSPAHAQDRSAGLDAIFGWATPETPGCALGVAQNGEPLVSRAYGMADLEGGVPIGPTTVFDIGSVQKQFVAAAVLLLAEDGRLSLSDDVREYFPELPDYGHTVTVDHLLTHTSGIRDWIGLSNFSSEDEDALAMILRQRGLNFAPGEEWSYSNSGYVLAKELVARVTGMSFAEFARRRLFEPLGLRSTQYAEDIRAAGEDAAHAYEKEGGAWKPDMMLGEERGGGAVLSTAEDLLIWNEALTNARLGGFVTAKLQEPARLNNGRVLGYARGLMLDDDDGVKVVWHTGGARGFGAALARFPEHGLSIAVLCNAGDAADDSRRRVMQLFAPRFVAAASGADTPAEPGDVAGVPAPDLSGKAGFFLSERTGEPLRLSVDDGRLRVAGGPALVPVAADRFRNREASLWFLSGAEFELRFASADELELRTVEGEATRYRRATPLAPARSELQQFAGRYESEELRSVLEVTPAEGGLEVQLNGRQTIPFEAVARDTFQRSRFTVRFRRDPGGSVVALELSNPVLRNVTFTRAGDGAEHAPPSPRTSRRPGARRRRTGLRTACPSCRRRTR